MAKLARQAGHEQRTASKGPIATTGAPVYTYEGHLGTEYDPRSELFLLAVTNMVGENTFYETGKQRDERFRELVHHVTELDAGWIARFLPFLRREMFMRTASVVMACEAAAKLHELGKPGGRAIIDSALARADEPAEALAYWLMTYGRKIPKSVKRGIADAAVRLYNERSLLKWDSGESAVRFADVIELCHPKPSGDWQSALFAHAINRRHGRDINYEAGELELLPTIARRDQLMAVPVDVRGQLLETMNPAVLEGAGITWEALSGWLQGPMDANAWERVIPSMGYMALLRNLRNFDQAGISPEARLAVKNHLADAGQVARSMQFPYRFLSAYDALDSLEWAPTLEAALKLSCSNIPAFDGRTIVFIDSSGSMRGGGISARSRRTPVELASLFGIALALRQADVDVVFFDTDSRKVDDWPKQARGASVLKVLERCKALARGGSTNFLQAVTHWYDGHDRIVVFSDMQWHPGPELRARKTYAPIECPMYLFNLGGYRPAPLAAEGNRLYLGGLSDAVFRMIPLFEQTGRVGWPF